MDNFGKFLSENTVIFDDFSPKITKVDPKYVSLGSIQDGVAITRIRYQFLTLRALRFKISMITCHIAEGYENENI